ncbi:MAG TPA: DedA family protein [Conexibacter sp.]|nr:DedA family protein [Conexibacter sp.]
MSPTYAVLGITVSSSLGYLLPALVGLESMGIPSPGETALVLAAVLASQGKLQIEWVIAIAAVSAIVGDNIGYWIGRKAGRRVLCAPRGPFHRRRIALIAYGDRFFAKHGARAVFLGRWMALVRVTAAWMAGMNHMRFRTFFLWNALGGISWACGIGLVAYFAGDAAVHVIERVGVWAAVAFGVLIVGAVAWVQIRERRELREQEAAGLQDPAAQTPGARGGSQT